jgi:hypothetical protein
MSELFSFRKMITPTVIQIIFWILIAVNVIAAIALIARGSALIGLIWLVVGPLIVRVYCEILIVVFRMHEALETISQNTNRRTVISETGV